MPFEIHSTGRGLFWRCPVCGVGGIGTVDSVPKAEAAGAKHVCVPARSWGTSHREVLMDCLVAWAQLGTEMREIALPGAHYLCLANEITTAVGVDPRATQVGVSFTFHGPTGPVMVRNADARLNDDHGRHLDGHARLMASVRAANGGRIPTADESMRKSMLAQEGGPGIRSWPAPDTSVAHLDVDLLADDA